MSQALEKQFPSKSFAHHAYGISNSSIKGDVLEQYFQGLEFSYVHYKQYETFKIADARNIKALASEKTPGGSVFIINFSVALREAQNALLKVIEEPATNTYFILLCPNPRKLLPTILSRLELIDIDSGQNKNTDLRISAKDFYEMKLQDRFAKVKELTDKKSDAPIQKSDVLALLDDCELYVKNIQPAVNARISKKIFKARGYVSQNGASMKMILDYLAVAFEYC